MIYLVAGHGGRDSGAVAYDGTTEASLTIELRDLISQELEGLAASRLSGTNEEIEEDRNDESFHETLTRLAKSKMNDFILDIHFNYNTDKAYGTEAFVHEKTSLHNRNMASDLCVAVSKAIGTHNRGPKNENQSQHSRLATLQFAAPAILLEVCFLNKKDLPAYRKKKLEVAKAIANILHSNLSTN